MRGAATLIPYSSDVPNNIRNAWGRAANRLDELTPPDRDRVADATKAAALFIVVIAHLLLSAIWVPGVPLDWARDTVTILPVVGDISWAAAATWFVQIMPLFFWVGGTANHASWARSHAAGTPAAVWVWQRIRRLWTPVITLVVVWGVIGNLLWTINPPLAELATKSALVPLWFLAVYTPIITLTPLVARLDRRFGHKPVLWTIIALVAALDAARYGLGWEAAGWLNMIVAWSAVHHAGAGGWHNPRRSLQLITLGAVGIWIGLTLGPYHPSMLGDPGLETNNLPPNLMVLCLGAIQAGVLSAAQPRLDRWLRRPNVWLPVAAVSRWAMPTYVWHMTGIAILSGLVLNGWTPVLEWLVTTDGYGSTWWWGRLSWIVVGLVLAAPVIWGSTKLPTADGAGGTTRGWAAAVAVVCWSVAILFVLRVGVFDTPLNWAVTWGGFAVAAVLTGFGRRDRQVGAGERASHPTP